MNGGVWLFGMTVRDLGGDEVWIAPVLSSDWLRSWLLGRRLVAANP